MYSFVFICVRVVLLNFERYRSLIESARAGLSESAHLTKVCVVLVFRVCGVVVVHVFTRVCRWTRTSRRSYCK